ncbi:MAG: hypothetical protein Q7J32_14740, partial [Sphingomonadaceae bacterium]|nr:hypothetical protein [Sphingomonadaceae bacterium]
MKWITATDLGRWGESIPARTELPGLVGDLIRATAEGITAFRFPSGDKGQVRGFDGHLLAGKGSTYVPEGRSYWEFGATKAQASKFGEDIGKRSDQVSEDDQKDVTFVFVTPQTWDKPQQKIEDAVKACREASRWKDVRYIDGVQLESWLDEAPAVAATHARLTLRTKPQIGARSSEEFWESYSGRFRVDLTEEVLLCEREEHAQQLLDHIKGRNGILTFTADSPDEVIAFAVAAIRKASAEERLFLEARTLIVDSEEAAFELRAADKLAFLTRDRAVPHAGMLSRVGPTVVGVGYDQKRGNDNFLGNPSFHAMGKALATMEGISEDGGLMLARRAGRSVTILARTIPRGAPENPAWLAEGRALVPSLLAGGWNGASDDDRRIVGMLTADGDYTRLEEALRPLCRTQDAPIDLFGDVWQMRSPVDAFVHLGHLITRADLERLERAVTEVFGTIVPEQEEDEPFSLSGRQDAGYSSWVRTGLSTTLLHLAVLAEQANFSVAGVRPQHLVNDLISGLPG